MERTVHELTGFGISEARAREAIASIGDPTDVNLAMNWLFDHGEEDKGGAVVFKHCPHVDELGHEYLVKRTQLEFGKGCVHGCAGQENWVCLMCGESRCGRYANRHSFQHWQKTREGEEGRLTVEEMAAGAVPRGHCLTLSLMDLSVWCYECDGYVQHESLQPLVGRMEQLKFGIRSDGAADRGAAAEAAVGNPIPVGSAEAHGRLGDARWPLPKIVRVCNDEARPGYQTKRAHEYLDAPEVLSAKVRMLADLVRRSRNLVAYTGAGLSTAAGIRDYATKASHSVGKATERRRSPWEAQPTLAHRALVALHKAGHLKHWVQQNHDGLPQKAGFPQADINEIHGAWYDPSNPVVPMSGTLRQDLIERMLEWEDRADLCLAMGTSMVGMNADRMAVSPAERQRRGQQGAFGTVIVALQQTQYDQLASLRIFATIDRVMELLAENLGLSLPPPPTPRPWANPPILTDLPYSLDGRRDCCASLTLDLRPGRRLRVVRQPRWDEERWGETCEVVEAAEVFAQEGHIMLLFGTRGSADSVQRVLGRWWIEDAAKGLLETLPVVPCM